MQILQYAVYMAVSLSLATVAACLHGAHRWSNSSWNACCASSAETDGLTGVLVRNRFLDLGRDALQEAHRQRQPVSMLFLDADHFKRINDEHGHAAGDAALIALAARLRGQGRKGRSDRPHRRRGIRHAAARRRPCSRRWHVPSNCAWPCRRATTRAAADASIGVAACGPDYFDSIEGLLARADQAMRQAKRDGRDRVVTAPPESSSQLRTRPPVSQLAVPHAVEEIDRQADRHPDHEAPHVTMSRPPIMWN